MEAGEIIDEKIKEIQEQLCRAFCEEIRLHPKTDKLTIIEAPFHFPDGDPCQIYLMELPTGGFRVTDSGHTLMHLSYENDIKKFKEGTRGQLLEQIMLETGLKYDNGSFYLDTTLDKLPFTIMQMGQALTKIWDLTFLSRARVESTFYEDLKERLYHIVNPDKIHPDYIYKEMEDAKDYPIDYYIEGKPVPLYLFGISGRDKARLVNIILERLLRYQESDKFESLMVFQDWENIPKQDAKRLMNIGGEMISSLDAEDDFKIKLIKRVGQN